METGESVPDFTVPLANGDVDQFTLSERLDEAPIVFAFFPAAFTGVCTTEMASFEDRLDAFDDVGGTVYGISVDTPFALNAFRDDTGLSFAMLSDTNRELVDLFDVSMDFISSGVDNVAKRSVFVVDADRTVQYAWVSEDPGIEPDYDAVEDAVRAIA